MYQGSSIFSQNVLAKRVMLPAQPSGTVIVAVTGAGSRSQVASAAISAIATAFTVDLKLEFLIFF